MKTIATCCLLITLLVSCEHDFIEDDLSGKTVSIIAPADDDTITSASPLFWWHEISGARSYRLQIAYPDFNSPQQLLYDTAVEGDRFIPALNPGYSYYWRIRPENGSSEGDWITRRLTVDSAAGLSTQMVSVLFPATSGMAFSGNTISFVWNTAIQASLYRIEIINLANNAQTGGGTTTGNSFTATLAQGNYEFKVRAENATSFTAWSTRTFLIDQTPPATPTLVSPVDQFYYSAVPAAINFDWSNSSDAHVDSLIVSTDSTFTSGIVLQATVPATTGNYNWSAAAGSTTYYWRVRSIDLAGNRSSYSSTFSFIIN